MNVSIDGLKISAAERITPGYFKDISFLYYTGQGDYIILGKGASTGTATLYYTVNPDVYINGAPYGDSIIVTLTDTIRNKTTVMEFWISKVENYCMCMGGNYSLSQVISSISVYPSPATDFVTVDLVVPITGEVALWDVLGKQLYNKNFLSQQQLIIPLNGFPSEIYIIKITDGSTVVTKEISKQ